ncbi:MAG: tetratricopeptide repeat protein [bacterium]
MQYLLAAAVTAFFVSIPFLNELVFKTPNLQEIRRQAAEKLSLIKQLHLTGDTKGAKDSCKQAIADFSANKDPLSKFVIQTLYFRLAFIYRAEFDWNNAILYFDSLTEKFPKTPYAENSFFYKAKCYEEKANINHDKKAEFYNKAIENYEEIEQNREEALTFPKYRGKDLEIGKYINSDQPSERKKNRYLHSNIYTEDDRLSETAVDSTQVQGELLSEAILNIGKCYNRIGEADKARIQYKLITDFFMESDFVDDALKLIAESYVIEGDQLKIAVETESDPGKKSEMDAAALDRYKTAEESYLKFVNVFTQSELRSQAYIDLGSLYYKMKKSKEAAAAMESAVSSIKMMEQKAKVQIDIGSYYFSETKWEEAIEAYAKVLQNYSQTQFAANAQYLLGETYMKMKDSTQAVHALEKVLDFYRNSKFYPKAAHTIGMIYYNRKDLKSALKVFRQALNIASASSVAPMIQYQIGVIYMDLKEYDKAIKEFMFLRGTYDQKQWVERAKMMEIECYDKTGDRAGRQKVVETIQDEKIKMHVELKEPGSGASNTAENYIRRIEEAVDPEAKAIPQVELAKYYMRNNIAEFDVIKKLFEDAINNSNDKTFKANTHNWLAELYISKNDYEGARSIWVNEILEKEGLNEAITEKALFKVHNSFRLEKQYHKAIQGFVSFIEIYKTSDLCANAQYFIGLSYFENQEYNKALEAYQVVLDKYKDSEKAEIWYYEAVLGISDVYLGLLEKEKAISYLNDFLAGHPEIQQETKVKFYLKLARTYYEQLADFKNAVEYYNRIIKEFPGSLHFSAAAYFAGEAMQTSGDIDAAIEFYELVVDKRSPYFKAARNQEAKIHILKDPDSAVVRFDDILEALHDDTSSSPNDIVKVLISKGDAQIKAKGHSVEDAIVTYENAFNDFQNKADNSVIEILLVKLADIHNQQRQNDKVIFWSNKLIEKFPRSRFILQSHYMKGNAFYQKDDYITARNVFLNVVNSYDISEKDKNKEKIVEICYYLKADCLVRMASGLKEKKADDKYMEAISDFEVFLKKYPNSTNICAANFQIGSAYFTMQKWEKSRNYLERVVGNCKNSTFYPSARGYQAYCLNSLGKWSRARDIAREVTRSKDADQNLKKFMHTLIKSIDASH